MKKLRGFNLDDVQKVLDKFSKDLRYIITDQELIETFRSVIGLQPNAEILREIRKLLSAERLKTMGLLSVKIGCKFDFPPKPRDIIVALEASGYRFSRTFQDALYKLIHEQNAERWAQAAPKRSRAKLTLLEGDRAMWDALQRSYNMNSDALASMLLRIFTVVTKTGKVSPLEVPFLASTLSDKEMKMYADSFNFTVKKSRRSRV